jgi:uncharacterized protein
VSGRGSIYEFTVIRDSRIAGFEEATPFVCVAVELDEQDGLLVLANLVHCDWTEASVGRRVEVSFEQIREGFVLPQFVLAASQGS